MIKERALTKAIILGLLEIAPTKSWVKKNRNLIHIVLQILLLLLAFWTREWERLNIPEILKVILESI